MCQDNKNAAVGLIKNCIGKCYPAGLILLLLFNYKKVNTSRSL